MQYPRSIWKIAQKHNTLLHSIIPTTTRQIHHGAPTSSTLPGTYIHIILPHADPPLTNDQDNSQHRRRRPPQPWQQRRGHHPSVVRRRRSQPQPYPMATPPNLVWRRPQCINVNTLSLVSTLFLKNFYSFLSNTVQQMIVNNSMTTTGATFSESAPTY